MVSILSYVIAVVITLGLAIVLYPITAFFWVLGLFGKVADVMFKFTTRLIRALWADIRKSSIGQAQDVLGVEQWKCVCGQYNIGKFCSECGASMQNNEDVN